MKVILKNNSIVKDIKLGDFEEVTNSSKPYVIKFVNPTCYLCKAFGPIFEDLAKEYKDNFKFGSVNVSKERNLSKAFKIDGVPELFIVLKDDVYNIEYPEEPDPKSGYTKEYVVEYLEAFLNDNK